MRKRASRFRFHCQKNVKKSESLECFSYEWENLKNLRITESDPISWRWKIEMKQKNNKLRGSDSQGHTVDDFSTGTVVSYSFLSFFCYERVLLRRLAFFSKTARLYCVSLSSLFHLCLWVAKEGVENVNEWTETPLGCQEITYIVCTAVRTLWTLKEFTGSPA